MLGFFCFTTLLYNICIYCISSILLQLPSFLAGKRHTLRCPFNDLDCCNPFDCDYKDLNDFFANDLDNYSTELLGKTYCFTLDEDPTIIVCTFTISNDSIKTTHLPNSRRKRVIEEIPRQKQCGAILFC